MLVECVGCLCCCEPHVHIFISSISSSHNQVSMYFIHHKHKRMTANGHLIMRLTLLILLFPILASTEEKKEAQQNVSDFDVIDSNVDGLISYLEFQRWHRATLGAEPKNSATLFGTHDLDRDGKLTVAEFVPLAFELSRKPVREAEKIFQKFDGNSDGYLNAEELSNNREKSHSVSEEIVSGLLQVADIDGDGQISQSEFARVADTIESHISEEARNLGQAQSLMTVLDNDGDGQIRLDELSAYVQRYGAKKDATIGQMETAEKAIQKLDRDGDHAISLDELKKLPEVMMQAAGIRPIIPA